jgi:hypothetical protein
MKITKRQLRRIIREATYDQLPYDMGGPWVDKDVPVGKGAKEYDDLDRELTDEEIEVSMGWEPAGDPGLMTLEQQQEEFDRLVDSGSDPKELKATGNYPDVESLDSEVARRYFQRTMGETKMRITRRQLRRIIKEEKAKVLAEQAHQMYEEDDELRQLGDVIDNMMHYSMEGSRLMDEMGMRYGELAASTTYARRVKDATRDLADRFDSALDDIERFSK